MSVFEAKTLAVDTTSCSDIFVITVFILLASINRSQNPFFWYVIWCIWLIALINAYVLGIVTRIWSIYHGFIRYIWLVWLVGLISRIWSINHRLVWLIGFIRLVSLIGFIRLIGLIWRIRTVRLDGLISLVVKRYIIWLVHLLICCKIIIYQS